MIRSNGHTAQSVLAEQRVVAADRAAFAHGSSWQARVDDRRVISGIAYLFIERVFYGLAHPVAYEWTVPILLLRLGHDRERHGEN